MAVATTLGTVGFSGGSLGVPFDGVCCQYCFFCMHSSLGTVDSGLGLVFWETSSVESTEPGKMGADCRPGHPLSFLCAGALRPMHGQGIESSHRNLVGWKRKQGWLVSLSLHICLCSGTFHAISTGEMEALRD